MRKQTPVLVAPESTFPFVCALWVHTGEYWHCASLGYSKPFFSRRKINVLLLKFRNRDLSFPKALSTNFFVHYSWIPLGWGTQLQCTVGLERFLFSGGCVGALGVVVVSVLDNVVTERPCCRCDWLSVGQLHGDCTAKEQLLLGHLESDHGTGLVFVLGLHACCANFCDCETHAGAELCSNAVVDPSPLRHVVLGLEERDCSGFWSAGVGDERDD